MTVNIEGVILSATGTDENSRATALADAINGNATLAGKGITAQASTDSSGKLHVGTLAVKAKNATDATAYGTGSVPLATTQCSAPPLPNKIMSRRKLMMRTMSVPNSRAIAMQRRRPSMCFS